MKISKNDISIQPNEHNVKRQGEHKEQEIQRTVQKSVYEKGAPALVGQYYNPSFAGVQVVKQVQKKAFKNDLEKFNEVVNNVVKHVKSVIPDDLCNLDKIEKKAKILENMGIKPQSAETFVNSCKTEDDFANLVALVKCEVDSTLARDLIKEENMSKFKNLLAKGDSIKDAPFYLRLNELQENAARKIVKSDVPVKNAVMAVQYIGDEKELAEFTNKFIDVTKRAGFSEYNRAIASLSGDEYAKANKMISVGIKPAQITEDRAIFKRENFDDILNVAGGIAKLDGVKDDDKILIKIAKHLEKRPNFDVNDFAKYIKSIDKNKMMQMEPAFKNFTDSDWLKFVDFHYRLGTKTFDKAALTFPQDLTNFLSKNYLDGKGITSLFKVYPSTAREIGEFPSKWGIKTEKAKKQVYDAIDSFRETRNLKQLSSDLTNITGKKTTVSEIGAGAFGTAYKVSVNGAEDTSLKIFHKEQKMNAQIKNGSRVINVDLSRHGPTVEPQAGLYVNENVEGYVKMYFGKIAPNNEKDGFYVTQFLDDKIKPIDVPDPSRRIKNSDIVCGDIKPENVVHGKIIDYGGIRVLNSDGEFSHWKVGNLLNE